MGRTSKQKGNDWESTIEQQNDLLYARGRAYVHKSEEAIKVLSNRGDGKLICVPDKKSQPDYKGTLSGGRTVVFEAKSTSHDTRFDFSRVKDHQRMYLRRHRSFGAAAFVFVAHQPSPMSWDWYVLPIDEDGVIADVTDRKSFPFPDETRECPFYVRANELWLDTLQRVDPVFETGQ